MASTPTPTPTTTGTAQGIIPIASAYQIPKGLNPTTTPQGGTAYIDSDGTYGQQGAIYLPGETAFTLAPQTLPSQTQSVQSPTTGLSAISPINGSNTKVQPTGTSVKTAVTPAPAPTPTPSPTTPATAPTGTTAPVITPPATNPDGSTQLTAAQIQAQADALAATPIASSSSGTRTSSDYDDDFQDALDSIGSAPTPLDVNADQTNEENALGIPALQTNATNLAAQYQALQDQIEGEQATEKTIGAGFGVVNSLVNGKVTAISSENAQALASLKDQVTQANTLLSQANTAVQAYIKNDEASYTEASDAYEKAYTAAIAQYNDEETQANKIQTSAKANAQVIINSYKGSAVGISSITPEQETQWTALELQAGLPPGTIMAAVQAELTITKFTKGADGNMYVSGVDPNGVPYTAQVGYAGGTTTEANVGAGVQKNTATAGSSLTTAQYSKLNDAGVSQPQADAIVSYLTQGDSLEQIRQYISAAGGNPAILDYFNNVVGISTINKS